VTESIALPIVREFSLLSTAGTTTTLSNNTSNTTTASRHDDIVHRLPLDRFQKEQQQLVIIGSHHHPTPATMVLSAQAQRNW
jgi:hypothetical protein